MNAPRDSEAVADLFNRYFSIVAADSPALLDAAYALRYQVYCVEHAFLDPALQQGHRERDEYDEHSEHAVMIYRPSNDVVGCVRLVLPTPEHRDGMPIYKLLDGESRARLERLDPATLGEVSRYSVSKRFRRREGEEQYPDVGMSAVELADTRRLVPHISLGLFRAVGQLAAEHEVTMVCAAMAPALLRLLARFGFDFETLGPLVDYHGLRQPCLADIRGLAQGILKHDAVYGAFVTTTR